MPPTTPYRGYDRSSPYEFDTSRPRSSLSARPMEPAAEPAGEPAAVSYRAELAQRGRRPFHQPGLFYKDLRLLMYAFGDEPNPNPESVAVLEEMTVDFLTDFCLRANPSAYALGLGSSQEAAGAVEANGEPLNSTSLPRQPSMRHTFRHRAKLDDFKHALRNHRKKLGRLEQLLYADKMVTEARRIGGVEHVAANAGALGEGRPEGK